MSPGCHLNLSPSAPCSSFAFSLSQHRLKWKALSCFWLLATPLTVCGIIQARILEWAAIPFSRWSSHPRDQTQISCMQVGILYHLSHQGSPPNIMVFSDESALHNWWPWYWSFSISPSNECSGLIYFRIDWVDLLAVQGTLKSLSQHYSLKASTLVLSLLYGPKLTSVHDC